jgi:opacity protein-like surface antigen
LLTVLVPHSRSVRIAAASQEAIFDQISGAIAWQVGAGLRICISRRVSVDIGVRYVEGGDIEQQSILAGVSLALAP